MNLDNEKRLKKMKEQSSKIIAIADQESDSALKCIHLLSVAGGATAETYVAIEQRIMDDKDVAGAYHLALMAQSTADLPIDARALIELVVSEGNNAQLLSLLKNLPIPPVEAIKERILASKDSESIDKMEAYLLDNPDGYGSDVVLGSGQKDRIVPLSEPE